MPRTWQLRRSQLGRRRCPRARRDDVVVEHRRLLGDVVDRDVALGLVGEDHVHDDLGPVGAVRDEAEIAQRLLRRAELVLLLRELVREFDQEPPEAVLLVSATSVDVEVSATH